MLKTSEAEFRESKRNELTVHQIDEIGLKKNC